MLTWEKGMGHNEEHSEVTHFLNVDLDIRAASDLQPLVNSLGKKVAALFVGREKRSYCARLELNRVTKSADSTIREFCALIRGLPRNDRRLWDSAKTRDFSIGVQAGRQPNDCDFVLEAETVTAVAELGARIVLTVYAPSDSGVPD